MAKFLNTSKAYAEIEDIIIKANRELVLISPYIKIPTSLLERLKDAARKKIRIVLVCREKDLRKEDSRELSQVKNLELRYLKSLHAKCFYNEESMVITSLNLYESSKDNREMGILLCLKEDSDLFLEAREEAEFIVRSANPATRNIFTRDIGEISNTPTLGPQPKGYCIRGSEKIPFDVTHPFCREHYKSWGKYKDPNFKENYCHLCGEYHQTSFNKPLCLSCFKKNNS